MKAILVTYKGVTDTFKGWAKRLGIGFKTVKARWYSHTKGVMSLDDVFKPRLHHERIFVTHGGITDTITGWSHRLGIDDSSMLLRVRQMERGEISEDDAFVLGRRDKVGTIYLTHNGRTMSLVGWSRHLGLPDRTLENRYKKFKAGEMSEERMFYKGNLTKDKLRDFSKLKKLSWRGNNYSMKDLATLCGCSETAIRNRIMRGESIGKILKFAKDPNRSWHGTIYINGKKTSRTELCKQHKVSKFTVQTRMSQYGWDFWTALTTPVKTNEERVRDLQRGKRLRELKNLGLIT